MPSTASGGRLVEGTYDLVESIIWRSDCGAFNSQEVQSTLRVHDGIIDAAWSGPNFTGTATATYVFSISGSKLTLTRICGTLSEALSPQPYTAENGRLLVMGFPFDTVFEPVFALR